jgi:hypothetical protein
VIHKIGCTKGVQGELVSTLHLSSLCASTAQPNQQSNHPQRHYRVGGTKHITLTQAINIIEAVHFAKSVGLPLVAHLTIHWSLTDVGDDPNGELLAKLREGLRKWFHRRDVAFAAVWVREKPGGDVEHCHMLFHLPAEHCGGTRLLQLEAAIYRLVKRHGGNYTHERVIKLGIYDKPPYPDGKYFLKGGG